MDHFTPAPATLPVVLQDSPKAGADIYQHQPLHGHTWIRIIQLLPASSFDDPLKCHLIHLDRRRLTLEVEESKNHYYAVSYVWGQHALSHQLFIIEQGNPHDTTKLLAITPAVDALMRQFRANGYGATTNLWIDAICLNQKDRAEVQEQVFLMGEIYSEARGVRVWLGPEDEGVAEVFALLRRLSDPNYMVGLWKSGRHNDESAFEAEGAKMIAALNAITGLRHNKFASLQHFFAREFFTRRWVLQEAALNGRTQYCANKSAVPAHEVKFGLEVLAKFIAGPKGSGPPHLVVLDDRSFRGLEVFAGLDTSGGLLDNLWRYHDLKCSDARDKIVALCGFSAEKQAWAQGRIVLGDQLVSYDEGAAHIYQAFARHYLAQIDRIGPMFEHVHAFGSLYTSTGAGPSWCPDWNAIRPTSSTGWEPDLGGPQPPLRRGNVHAHASLVRPPGLHFIGEANAAIAMKISSLVVAKCLRVSVDATTPGTIKVLEAFMKINGWGPNLMDDRVYFAVCNLVRKVTGTSAEGHNSFTCLKKYYDAFVEIPASAVLPVTSFARRHKNQGTILCSQNCVQSFCVTLRRHTRQNTIFLAADTATGSVCFGSSSKRVNPGDLVVAGFPSTTPGVTPDKHSPVDDSVVLRRPVFRRDESAPLTAAEKAGVKDAWLDPQSDRSERTTKHDFSSVYMCRFHTMADVQPLNWQPGDCKRLLTVWRRKIVIR